MALTEERLADIEERLAKRAGWIRRDALELLAEVKRLRHSLESIISVDGLANSDAGTPGYLAWHMADLALSGATP